MTWTDLVIALIGSAFAGAINTLAGNGSAITLTLLTELLGLPGNLANGTNRVGIFTQSAAGAYAFYRNDKLDVGRSWLYIALTTLGAVAGIFVATRVSNEQFMSVFRFLMVLMLVVILVKPSRWLRDTDLDARPNLWLAVPAFLAIGFYGGFIQMGMGVFFLAVMVLGARYSLIEANAVKIVVVGLYTLLAILIFASQGLVDWRIGLVFATGQTLGGFLTAHYASRFPQANRWAYYVLVGVVVVAIVQLFR
jgi:uncharacterized membrane protein YfcA